MGETMDVLMIGNDGSRNAEQVHVHSLSSQQRMFDSLKRAALFWGIALLTAFIPILHFVLVPGFILTGFFVGGRSYLKRLQVISQSQVRCPSCQSEIPLDNIPVDFPIKGNCPACRKQYRIEAP